MQLTQQIFGQNIMGVSNRWNEIWNGKMEWKMEWNGECTYLQLIHVAGAVVELCLGLISPQRLYEQVQCML